MLRAGILLALLAAPAFAQQQCPPRENVVAILEGGDVREAQIAAGVTNEGAIVEIWTNERTGTWTVLLTTPDGRTCMVAFGVDWWQAKPGQPT